MADPASPPTPDRPVVDIGAPQWSTLADVLLQRAALIARLGHDRAPDPLAGLTIDHHQVDDLLGQLPGLRRGDDHEVEAVDQAAAGAVQAARNELWAALERETPFADLVRFAGLESIEAEVFAVLCAIEVDPRRQVLTAYLNDDVNRRRVTPFTLIQLFGAAVGAHLAVRPTGALRRAALLTPITDQPWAVVPVGVAPAVLWWLEGDTAPDPGLPVGADLVLGRDAPAGAMVERHVTVVGPDRVRRLQAAVEALPGASTLVTPMPADDAQWDAVIRQATLAQTAVVVEIADEIPKEARQRIERSSHLAWGLCSPHFLPLASMPRRPWVSLTVAPALAQRHEWAGVFGERSPVHHRLTADQLYLIANALDTETGEISEIIRRLGAGEIDQLATRIRPTRDWDDIVLEPDRLDQLHQIAARCRYRDVVFDEWGFRADPSTGVVALFSGPSGTGKTLAAEAIAGALGIDLFKVDLANLVSKYIGETEKNLARVFDAAGTSNVALFFDEADALLGKRSEVTDARDRYANIEVSYLLQRLERYDGLVIMATNLPKNIDPAFMRRIHVSIEFPMPQPAERLAIWERSIPKGAPCQDIDLDYLADTFELSGGSIRNIALTAAFLAVDAGTPLTMDTLTTAVKRELQKAGRLVTSSAFDPLNSLQ